MALGALYLAFLHAWLRRICMRDADRRAIAGDLIARMESAPKRITLKINGTSHPLYGERLE